MCFIPLYASRIIIVNRIRSRVVNRRQGSTELMVSYLVRRRARGRQLRQRRRVSWGHFPSRAVFYPASSAPRDSRRNRHCGTPSSWSRTVVGIAHRERYRPLPPRPLPPRPHPPRRRVPPRRQRPRAGRRPPLRVVDAAVLPGAGRRHGRSPARLDTWPADAATTTVASNVPPGSAALVNVSYPRWPRQHPRRRRYYLRRPGPSPRLRHRATWRHDRCCEALPRPGPSEPSHQQSPLATRSTNQPINHRLLPSLSPQAWSPCFSDRNLIPLFGIPSAGDIPVTVELSLRNTFYEIDIAVMRDFDVVRIVL